jgi:hypothetical protein
VAVMGKEIFTRRRLKLFKKIKKSKTEITESSENPSNIGKHVLIINE